jgi:hypothetical protein
MARTLPVSIIAQSVPYRLPSQSVYRAYPCQVFAIKSEASMGAEMGIDRVELASWGVTWGLQRRSGRPD